jgi:DNA (cytosine-5)-methyltransferase 1
MPRKNSYLTVTDQFCGAGGSSQGVRRLAERTNGGIEVKLALNHWALAIETHNTNFPDTIHDCTDISAADPRRYPSTDILITSPECTNHSLAKGKKVTKKQMDLFASGKLDASAERSRATMWDVPRFAEYHNYNIIIVENVVDARKWVMFDAWLVAMQSLGYLHKCVYVNSMHFHPTPQSRDRMYVVFWKKGNKAPLLDYTPVAHCPKCSKDIQAVQTWKKPGVRFGKYKQQYVYCCPSCTTTVEPYYYAAFNCIDWSDMGQRIGDRSKPLSPKTVTRIQYGIDRYGSQPTVITSRYTSGIDYRVKLAASEPLGTQPGDVSHGICTPFIVNLGHGQIPRLSPVVKSSMQPLPSQTTFQGLSVVTPFLTESRGKSTARAITDPGGTITAGGIHHGVVTTESWHSFLSAYYNGSNCTKHITEEMGSVTTTDRHSLVNFQAPVVEDCYYRMLKPREVKRGMAFADDYVILGNSREQVKQCGNAVTPPPMEYLVGQAVKSLS